MATYKVSLVIPGAEHGGAIVNMRERPQVGQRISIGDIEVEVIEVIDLIPPHGDFYFLHATCKLVRPQHGN